MLKLLQDVNSENCNRNLNKIFRFYIIKNKEIKNSSNKIFQHNSTFIV